MLRLSNKILGFTNAFSRAISHNVPKTVPVASTNAVVASNAVSQLYSNLENLRITTPPAANNYKNEIIDIPFIPRIIENPRESLINEIRDIVRKNQNEIIESPNRITPGTEDGIQAARLIVIRRRKMKKHKLRKLRKKMKFEWAKVRQRREMRKEKRFQAGLLFRIKKAEEFSAEEYVREKLRQANETPIPRFWKGKRLPQFIIKQKLGIK